MPPRTRMTPDKVAKARDLHEEVWTRTTGITLRRETQRSPATRKALREIARVEAEMLQRAALAGIHLPGRRAA